MKLDDGKAWFRRWMVIGFKPIAFEGRLLTSTVSGICALGGLLVLTLDGQSPWTEMIILLLLSLVLAAYAVIFWKLEERF